MPWRIDAADALHVLLITSRSTGRWVVPKGNVMPGLADHAAAAQEAYEEAGLRGIASPDAIGTYRYLKRRRDGTVRAMTVAVYPLAVTAQLDAWPEQGQRALAWFTPDAAAAAVQEPELRRLIAAFRAPAAGLDPLAVPTPIDPDPHPPDDAGLLRWLRRSPAR